MQVAVVNHLAGSIGISNPEMVEGDAAAVNVFPSLINDPSIGQRPGGVVVLDVGGNRFNVLSNTITDVKNGNLRVPSRDPSIT